MVFLSMPPGPRKGHHFDQGRHEYLDDFEKKRGRRQTGYQSGGRKKSLSGNRAKEGLSRKEKKKESN